MGLNDENLRVLEQELLRNPLFGNVIEGTGGARVIYLDVLKKEKLYFLFAYPKNIQENLTSEQKKAIKSIIEEIKSEAQ